MTDTYKILGQSLAGELALDGTTVKESIVYQVPANTQAAVSAIEITNSNAANKNYNVAFVTAADVASASTNISYTSAKYVAVNAFPANDKGAYSTNGTTWTVITMPSVANRTALAYGAGKFVAPNYGSNVVDYSEDGITWSSSTMPATKDWKSVVFADGKFVAIAQTANQSAVAYSTNGVNWSSGSNWSAVINWTSIVYGNGKFLAIATENTSQVAYSSDGINWNAAFLNSPGDRYALAYGAGKFVTLKQGSDEGSYSSDGINWTAFNTPVSGNWISMTYGNGKFVAVENAGRKAVYSTDGITWTQSGSLVEAGTWTSITYAKGLFIVVGSSIVRASYSTDGITWGSYELPRNSQGQANNWQKVLGVEFSSTQSIPNSSNKHIAIYNKVIASNQTHEIKGGVTLSAGDQIRVYSTSNDIITNVYGAEFS